MAKELSRADQIRQQREANAPPSLVGRFRPSKPAPSAPSTGTLGAGDARALTDEAKRTAEDLWRRLLELHDGQAHVALGYPSWAAYCDAEFGLRQSRAYQLLDAGRVLAAIESAESHSTIGGAAALPVGNRPTNERQARELALLIDEPEQMADALAEAAKDGEPTAAKVRRAVERRTGKTPRRKAPQQVCFSASEFEALTSALLAGQVGEALSLVERKAPAE